MDAVKKFSILENKNVDQKEDNKGLNKVFNVFWFIFVGLFSAIENAILGLVLCCTIIGIPAGITCFKIIPLLLKPAGRRVQLNYGKHPVLNTFAFIFGGVENYIIYCILGAIFCITIIGIPLGRQLFKIGKYYLAPYGCEIHLDGTYTEKRDTVYDMRLTFNNLFIDPKKKINTSEGELDADETILKSLSRYNNKELTKINLSAGEVYKFANNDGTSLNSFPELIANFLLSTIVITGVCIGMMFLVPYISSFFTGNKEWFKTLFTENSTYISLGIHLFVVAEIILILLRDFPAFFKIRRLHKIYKKEWVNLSTYYPNQISLPSKRSEIELEGKYITSLFGQLKPKIDLNNNNIKEK